MNMALRLAAHDRAERWSWWQAAPWCGSCEAGGPCPDRQSLLAQVQ
jgi:hypothetical protein